MKNRHRAVLKLSAALLAALFPLAVAARDAPAPSDESAVANVTGANVNAFNLLAPFLALPATDAGRETLASNLSETIRSNKTSSQAQRNEAVSDKYSLVAASNPILLLSNTGQINATYGVAANLAGGLPLQPTPVGADESIKPQQPVGGYGHVLGPIFQMGVAKGANGPLATTVAYLLDLYSVPRKDTSLAKFYLANGTVDARTPAAAPEGFTLPTHGGLPNKTDSVLDLAYGVKNTGEGQNIYGNSRPLQVARDRLDFFDPTAIQHLDRNPAFPSGHTAYAYSYAMALAMLTPELYQAMLLRASDYGHNRTVLGVHYILDVIASRALVSYDLANLFSNPDYISRGDMTGKPIDAPGRFPGARAELKAYLEANCGGTVAACGAGDVDATANPYLPSELNAKRYAARINYGLPVLSYENAPRESAPAGTPDAAVLLAPVFGGTSEAAKRIAPEGGISGSLSSETIRQIIVNTQAPALAAFHGTPLGYWLRLNLYDAIGYFQNIDSKLKLAKGDIVLGPVAVAQNGVLGGEGSIGTSERPASVTLRKGGALAPAQSSGALTINGPLTFENGSSLDIAGLSEEEGEAETHRLTVNGNLTLAGTVALAGPPFQPGKTYDLISVRNGAISGAFEAVTCGASGLTAVSTAAETTKPCGEIVIEGSKVKLTIPAREIR